MSTGRTLGAQAREAEIPAQSPAARQTWQVLADLQRSCHALERRPDYWHGVQQGAVEARLALAPAAERQESAR